MLVSLVAYEMIASREFITLYLFHCATFYVIMQEYLPAILLKTKPLIITPPIENTF